VSWRGVPTESEREFAACGLASAEFAWRDAFTPDNRAAGKQDSSSGGLRWFRSVGKKRENV
jgi:formylglycine-generating enzyme required for sulfatase activity